MASPPNERNDVAIAQKAINLARGLSGADKAVASAIIDHFNRKTGQCDPSIDRLAALLGIEARTVKRATAALCEEHNMFRKKSHGGKSFRASYTPNWSTFRDIVKDWDNRMKANDASSDEDDNGTKMSPSEADKRTSIMVDKGTEMSPCTGQKCPVEGDKNVPQTYLNNQYTKPIPPHNPSECDAVEPLTSNSRRRAQGLLRGEKAALASPNYQSREKAATAGCTKAEAALSAADARLTAEIQQSPAREQLWLFLIENGKDGALRAEMRRRGGGLAFIRDAMLRARLGGTGEGASHVH